jgi:ribosomal protein L11 methylase PrmA
VVELVNNQDWLQLCYRNFPPQIIPPFFIYGSYDPDVVIPSDAIALKIDAATDFGSG